LDSFPVICETCHARLRVRGTRVIGEIHACPKCGSMVRILPPAGWSPPEPTEPAISEVSQTAPAADSSGTREAAEIDTLLRQVAASASDPAAAAAPLAAPRTLFPVNRWVLWSAGGVGVLAVGGLLAAVLTRGTADTVDASPSAATETAVTVAPVEAAEIVPPARSERSEDASDGLGDMPTAVEPVEAVASSTLLPVLPERPSAEADSPAADVELTDAKPTDAQPPAVPGGRFAPPQPPPVQPASNVAKFDPLDFDPTQLNLSSTGVAEMVPPADDEGSEDASDGLRGGMPTEADTAGVIDSSLPPTTAAVQLGPASSDALRTRDVATQLSLKIGAIDMPQVPLVRVLEMISDLADVPITLEPSALEMSGISPGFPVTLHAEDVAIADLLTAALAQCQLGYEARDGQIVVAKPDVDDRRSVNYRVDDLVAPGAADAKQMAEMIERFVAPDAWQSSGGSGTIAVDGKTLRVDQTERVLYQVLTFCERLRLARGLATRSRYPVDRLSIEPVYPQLAARLSAKTTFTFLPWSRLVDVLRHWEDEADVTVLVDWPALAEVGLAPSSPVACAITDRTWNDALDAVLTPIGLAWQAVDAQTIQVTSRSACSRSRQVEFYPVSERLLERFAGPDALIAQLVDEAKKQIDDNPVTGPPVEIALDAPSGRLVVLAPPAVHRYLAERLSGAAE
jgi:hypothetical protein